MRGPKEFFKKGADLYILERGKDVAIVNDKCLTEATAKGI